MKPAICHYSFHRRWKAENWTPERLAAEVRVLGVEALDFHAGLLGMTAGAARLMRDVVVKHGLTLSGVSLSNNFNQEKPEDFRAQVAMVKQWIRIAAEAGARVSRIFGGSLTRDERRDPGARARRRQRVLDGLGQVVGEAAEHGIVLALENHGGLPCTAEEQVQMIEAIGSPWLRATVDIGNYMSCGQEAHVGTRLAASHCAYVHFKDFRKIPDPTLPWGWGTEACILGEGDVNLHGCVAALRDSGYAGFVALEYEGKEDEQTGVPRSVAFMRSILG